MLARTSSIKSAFLFLCFPGFREEPKKSPACSVQTSGTLLVWWGRCFRFISHAFVAHWPEQWGAIG
ncbi:hypothetical protein CJF36_22340 [Pseudomonas lundensis]|nr:hypothetical protein CJF36_22340 [Pseudomonas lundensis]